MAAATSGATRSTPARPTSAPTKRPEGLRRRRDQHLAGADSGRVVGGAQGQVHGEGGALPQLALDLDAAAVQLDEPPREGQAQAGPLGAHAVGLGELLELAEQAG